MKNANFGLSDLNFSELFWCSLTQYFGDIVEFVKCRLDNFSMGFIMLDLNLSLYMNLADLSVCLCQFVFNKRQNG